MKNEELTNNDLFFAYAKMRNDKTFRLFGLFDNRTYFRKAHTPRYKIIKIEELKNLAIELVDLNKDENLHIKFIGANNKELFKY